MSTSLLSSFAEHNPEDNDNNDNIEEIEKISKNRVDGKSERDEDIEKELHTKPLDVSTRFPGDKNKCRNLNLNKQDNFHGDDEDIESSLNLEDPFENKEINLDAADTDLPATNSLSNLLVSPLPSKHKKGLFQRAYSDPSATNERTPLTSSSSDGSNSTGNKMKGYKSFNKSISTPGDSTSSSSEVSGRNNLLQSTEEEGSGDKTKQTFKSLASFATLTKWWKKNAESKKKKRDKIEEKKMRVKLQYHFMTPFEKYKLGRKPWKLGVQILKILVVTTQVSFII